MCTRIHATSFIKKMTDAVKRQIKHQPDKVGELLFKNYLPPRLCHLDPKMADGQATINDGIGKTLMFIVRRYDDTGGGAIEQLLDRLFDENMTPSYVASILIAAVQVIVTEVRFTDAQGKKFNLPEPEKHDFGSKKIFFLPLLAMIDLIINMLLGNSNYADAYLKREKEWIDYVNFVLITGSETRH
jgi:hypothetical protein